MSSVWWLIKACFQPSVTKVTTNPLTPTFYLQNKVSDQVILLFIAVNVIGVPSGSAVPQGDLKPITLPQQIWLSQKVRRNKVWR